MKFGADRILTTHVGSLPRPPGVLTKLAPDAHYNNEDACVEELTEGAPIASQRLWG